MKLKQNPETLLSSALEAAEKAYAPYSGFRVGAAVLLEDGTVVTGNNQENRAYPLSSCAERVAVNYARATYPILRIDAIAITSPDAAQPVSPCGGCREVLMEVMLSQKSDIQVIMGFGETTEGMQAKIASELLPYAFSFEMDSK